jgi:hypothetical protein
MTCQRLTLLLPAAAASVPTGRKREEPGTGSGGVVEWWSGK